MAVVHPIFQRHNPMKKLLAVLLFLCVALLVAQTVSDLWLPIWNSAVGRYQWKRLGSGFTISGDTINVTAQPSRIYGVILTKSPTAMTYPLPVATASNVVVYVNGLRYVSPQDYTITAGVVTPACTPGATDCNWPPVTAMPQVVADYDK